MLKVNGLNHFYSGKEVIKHMNFAIEEGLVLGLLGPNGSGKTTILKILSGVLEASGGQIHLSSETLDYRTKNQIAFLPENNHLYDFMTVKEIYDMYVMHYEDFDTKRFDNLIKIGFREWSMKMSDFSKGRWQCFRLALLLARRARLYLLDEPLSGVDIIERERLVEMIRSSVGEGCSMLVTSHLVADIEVLLDKVIFIKSGQIICSGEGDILRAEYGMSISEIYKEVLADVQNVKV